MTKLNFNKTMLIVVLSVIVMIIVWIIIIGKQRESHIPFAILFAKTSNLGDDVQTIAQMQYLPKNTRQIIVDREKVNKDSRKCYLIMNGWWMHNDKNFPPHENITPIYISFHIEKNGLLSNKAIAHYKKFEPIGCRDIHTMEKLKQKGVDAYFSGCLTLTLKNPFTNFKRNNILIVDAHLPSKVVYPWGADHLLAKLIPQHIQDKAEYLEHELPNRIDRNDMIQRQAYTQTLLNKYATAKLVITSRLHCALPCVAYGTPVIVLQQNLKTDNRFTGLRDYFHGYSSINDVVDFDFGNPQPKLSHTELKNVQHRIVKDINHRIKKIINK